MNMWQKPQALARTERGVSCREFTTRVSTSSKKDAVRGTACRRGTGDWEFRT